jgi:two-component system LytT family sensor kinase
MNSSFSKRAPSEFSTFSKQDVRSRFRHFTSGLSPGTIHAWWWVLGILSFQMLSEIPQLIFYHLERPQRPSWAMILLRYLLAWFTWVLVTPLIFWFGRLFPIGRKNLIRNLLIHLVWSWITGTIATLLFYLSFSLFSPAASWRFLSSIFRFPELLRLMTNRTLFYTVVLGIHQANIYFSVYQDREFRLQQAQLQILKTQLQPHFLFNTLHTISAHMYSNVEKADLMITHLGDFLRSTLRDLGDQEVTLRHDLETLNSYLQIELMRFDNRLKLEMEVDPAVMNARVPNLILQPLVENAIRHGIAPYTLDGYIGIRAQRIDDQLWLQVRDSGPGISQVEASEKIGIGLANTRARLEHLYAGQYRFELRKEIAGGFAVDIRIPYREFSDQSSTA